ncbi:MAG: DUF4006 family protein [SAR324 cluster bacterium]|nr:DUF4006 family protein [SAR324 cluster bacterium]
MFKLQGLGGFLLLVVVLVSLWAGIVTTAVDAQSDNATNYITK